MFSPDRNSPFQLGWFLHPLVYGDYPSVMKTTIAEYSSLQGYPFSRLPEFTAEEQQAVKGAFDFVALNHYTSAVVRDASKMDATATRRNDRGTDSKPDPSWERSMLSWFAVSISFYIGETLETRGDRWTVEKR